MKLIDGEKLYSVVKGHHDFFSGAMVASDKARRDELSQVMADIVNAPEVTAVPVEWLKRYRDSVGEKWGVKWHTINDILEAWEREQK